MKLACGGRMPESVELCIQMPNVRICRTVCTDQLLVKESNIENLRIHKTVDANRPRMSETIKLLIQIDRGCVTKKPNVRINRTVAKKTDV